MRRGLFLSFVLLLLVAGGAYADPDPAPAVKAAQSWLALLDQGKYDASWQASAPLFQGAVSSAAWSQQLQAALAPFGKLQSRSIAKTQYATTLPGAPDGEYWMIQTQASFANKASAVETLTLMLVGKDWKPVGYFIR